MLQEAGRVMPIQVLLNIILGLSWKMLLPLVIGQFLHVKFRNFARKHKKKVGIGSNTLILITVLLSIAKSSSNPAFFDNFKLMGGAIIFLALSHYVLIACCVLFGKLLRFPDKDMVSIVYTAPQKTLAMGVPLLTAYFAGDPVFLGLAIIPILFYHPWQIMNASFLKLFPFVKKSLNELS
jgi:sodium/bile acid cotransporter 7